MFRNSGVGTCSLLARLGGVSLINQQQNICSIFIQNHVNWKREVWFQSSSFSHNVSCYVSMYFCRSCQLLSPFWLRSHQWFLLPSLLDFLWWVSLIQSLCLIFTNQLLYFKTEANLNFHGKFHVKSTISAFHSRPGQTCILISSDERAALSFLKKTSKSFIFFSSDERASLSFLARNSRSAPSWYSWAKRRGDVMPWWRNL